MGPKISDSSTDWDVGAAIGSLDRIVDVVLDDDLDPQTVNVEAHVGPRRRQPSAAPEATFGVPSLGYSPTPILRETLTSSEIR